MKKNLAKPYILYVAEVIYLAISEIKSKIPIIEIIIPIISINLLTIKRSIELVIFFISILDESNLTLCII